MSVTLTPKAAEKVRQLMEDPGQDGAQGLRDQTQGQVARFHAAVGFRNGGTGQAHLTQPLPHGAGIRCATFQHLPHCFGVASVRQQARRLITDELFVLGEIEIQGNILQPTRKPAVEQPVHVMYRPARNMPHVQGETFAGLLTRPM